jgi:outer membrane lipoprotein SlyB
VRAARALSLLLAAALACGCRSYEPVLYPNEKLRQVYQDEVDRDIGFCEANAAEYTKNPSRAGRAAGSAVEGGAVGGAAGAAAGAVLGNVGRGAGTGAAAGAAGGLVRGIFHSRDPSPVYKAFVERCLKDRGYEVIGWE